ncbi:MAG: hypothetical protein QW478_00225 [Candidatus Micrarchaeaceae archaeon]
MEYIEDFPDIKSPLPEKMPEVKLKYPHKNMAYVYDLNLDNKKHISFIEPPKISKIFY